MYTSENSADYGWEAVVPNRVEAPVSRTGHVLPSMRQRIWMWVLLMLVVVGAWCIRALLRDPGATPVGVAPSFVWAAPLILAAALFCEFVDSSLGMGYGTTLTPLLILAGYEPIVIVPAVILSESLTGLTAGILHHREGNIDFLRDRQARSVAMILSVLSAAGAITAVTVAISIPKSWHALIIAIIVVSVGAVILGTLKRRLRFRRVHLLVLGAIAAFNKGLSGGGYGPIVTGGQVVLGVPAKSAVAITSLAESFVCIVALFAYLATGHSIEWALAAPLICGALLSVPLATMTVRIVPEHLMRSCVGVVTLLLGVLMLWRLC